MFRYIAFAFAFLLIGVPAAEAADCTNPVKAEGTIIYNTTHRVMQYCNGTDWVNMGAAVVNAGGGITVSNTADCVEGQDVAFNYSGGEVVAECRATFRSCKAILDAGVSTGDGVYTIDPDGVYGDLAAFDVYCDMTTDGGGWTLIMRMGSGDTTFVYDSAYWENTVPYNDDILDPTTDTSAKFESYSKVYGDEIRGCGGATGVCITEGLSSHSTAQTVFLGDIYQAGTISRTELIAVFPPDDTTQPNCNYNGLNAEIGSQGMKVRFGLIGNNENNCTTTNSAWGFGIADYCSAGNRLWRTGNNISNCLQGTLWIR